MFGKNEKGYTPWTARKAPLFNNSLNATYVRVNTALLFSAGAFAVGIVASPVIQSFVYPHIPGTYHAEHQVTKPKLTEKPVPIAKVTPVVEKPVAPVAVAQSPIVVPAIPMGNPAAATKATPLSPDEILRTEYGLNAYDSILIVNSAKDVSQATGIEAPLLLALIAHTTKFQIFKDKKYVGLFSLNPALHPTEVQKLVNNKMSYTTIDGSLRLGAEVLSTYRTQSGGDLNAALTKFISSYKKEEQPVLSNVLETRTKFEKALHG